MVKVDISVDSGRSSVKSGDRYVNFDTTDFVEFEGNSDIFELIYNFNQFCWKRAAGFKSPPLLPPNLSEVTATNILSLQRQYSYPGETIDMLCWLLWWSIHYINP